MTSCRPLPGGERISQHGWSRNASLLPYTCLSSRGHVMVMQSLMRVTISNTPKNATKSSSAWLRNSLLTCTLKHIFQIFSPSSQTHGWCVCVSYTHIKIPWFEPHGTCTPASQPREEHYTRPELCLVPFAAWYCRRLPTNCSDVTLLGKPSPPQ
jgi:hypothetical protein